MELSIEFCKDTFAYWKWFSTTFQISDDDIFTLLNKVTNNNPVETFKNYPSIPPGTLKYVETISYESGERKSLFSGERITSKSRVINEMIKLAISSVVSFPKESLQVHFKSNIITIKFENSELTVYSKIKDLIEGNLHNIKSTTENMWYHYCKLQSNKLKKEIAEQLVREYDWNRFEAHLNNLVLWY